MSEHPDLQTLIEKWIHESRLQTFEDRERFRQEARDVLAALAVPPPQTEEPQWLPVLIALAERHRYMPMLGACVCEAHRNAEALIAKAEPITPEGKS